MESNNKQNIIIEDFRHMYRLVQELLKIAMNNNQNEMDKNDIEKEKDIQE